MPTVPCRSEEGGTPGCKLAFDCSQVQIKGKSLNSIEISRERRQPYADNDLDHDYDLFIVVDRPNRYDDLKGHIGFDSNFEKILDFAKKAGFSRDKVYVTYLNKCFSKRKPTVQEIKACLPHIYDEIELARPKVIMTLGSGVLRLFNLHNKGGINTIRGKHFNLPLPDNKSGQSYWVIPSYDPGFFKHNTNPQIEQRAIDDYRTALKLITTGKAEVEDYKASYILAKSVEDVRQIAEKLKLDKFFAFDTESRSLPWDREPLTCFSFCWGPPGDEPNTAIVPIYQHDPDGLDWKLKKYWGPEDQASVIKILKNVFKDPTISKAAHNAKYDLNTVRKHTGIKVKGFIFDSMLMHHILSEQKPHGLEYLADIEFGVGDYSSKLHEIVGRGTKLRKTYDYIPDNILWPYAANDAECCWKLTKLYYNQLLAKPHLWKLYQEETEPLIHTLADAEWHGHYIRKDTLKILHKDYTSDKERLLVELQNLTWPTFNPSSPTNVKEALIQMGHKNKILDPKKATGYSTGKEVLLAIADKVPFAKKILEFRNVIKILGTYLENISADVDTLNRVRYSWLIHGTESGRLSCRIYHQLPNSDKKRTAAGRANLRDAFAVPLGKKLVYFDYSQVELRVLAILSEDKELLRLFADGIDIHTATAAVMLGLNLDQVSDKNRQLGKAVNFGLAYGSEGHDLIKKGEWEDRNGIVRPLTWAIFNKGMRNFRLKFPNLTSYLDMVPEYAKQNDGVFATPYGRERRMGIALLEKEEYKRKAAEREVKNFSIQSTASGITCRTINLIHTWIENWRTQGISESDIFLVNTVHDSAAWEVDDKYVDWFVQMIYKAATRPIKELQDYSFPCAIGIGETWSEAESDSKKPKDILRT